MVSAPFRVRAIYCFLAIGLGFGSCLANAAAAADLGLPPAPQFADNKEKQVEWGSGWYLRGDLGFSKDSQPPINADMSYSNSSSSKSSWSGSLGVGNKINAWLREDTTLELTNGMNAFGETAAKACQTGATINPDGITYTPVYSTCYGDQHASLKRGNLMQNAYADLGTWYGITPYIGAGVGLAHVTVAGNIHYYDSATGMPYNPTWTDGSGSHTVTWDKTYTPKSTTQLAWSVMGGFAIDASDHVKIDIGARYLNSGHLSCVDSVTGDTIKKQLVSKQLKVGLRYMFD